MVSQPEEAGLRRIDGDGIPSVFRQKITVGGKAERPYFYDLHIRPQFAIRRTS